MIGAAMQSITAERTAESDAAGTPTTAAAGVAVPVVLTVHHAMEEVEALWRELETVQSCPIHQTYDWCRAWVDATGVTIAIVVGRVAGEHVCLLPLEVVRCGGIRVARHIATRFGNINNGIFTDAGRRKLSIPAILASFLAGLEAADIGADCIVLDKVPLEWRGVRHSFAALPHYESQNAAFQITLDPAFETVLSRTNAKRKRKKFRTTTRRLDGIGGWRHVVAHTEAEALALVETFFRLKGQRLRAQGLPDVFAPEETRNFFRALARNIPAAGATHPLQMHAIRLQGDNDGAICAVAGLSRKGDHFACQFAAIDDSLCPDVSPGELLFHLMIEQSCRDGAALFDLGIGDQRYKRSWCDVETPHYEIVLPLTLAGRIYAGIHHGVVAAKHFVKHNRRAYRAATWLRGLTVKRSMDRE